MSWESDYKKVITCPCGKGKVVQMVFSDDWCRVKSEEYIDCPECLQRYHLEHKFHNINGESIKSTYLVKNGFCITPRFPILDSFGKVISHHYSYQELIEVGALIASVTSAVKLKGTIAEFTIKTHKDFYHTVKLDQVSTHLIDVIGNYNTFENNKDNFLRHQEECNEVERIFLF